MIKRDVVATVLAGIYVIAYLIAIQLDSPRIALLMVLFFPFILLSMIYTILRFGEYKGPDLGEEEFGYQDREKSELGSL